MKLTVVLGASSEASFDIVLNDNNFVRKWVDELLWCLDNCEFNQHEAFAMLSNLDEAAQMLTYSCQTINKYLNNFIEVRDNLVNQPQEYFNYLHFKFETLNGTFDKPTRLLSVANKELKTAIRNLNFFVHRVETKADIDPCFYISFNKDQYRRILLDASDYQYYDFVFPAGTLFVNYSELGKEFIDLYEDKLPLDYAGAKNLHYYSGESLLTLTGITRYNDPGYKEWLQAAGINPADKSLGHSRIPLGKVNDVQLVLELLKKYKYLKV